jgi:hypothetical protein
MVQVWKPEFERPGRHFVYTSRYVEFFFELLDKTNDRANYGLLLRRLRKKPAEYFDHKDLWQEECVKYIKVGSCLIPRTNCRLLTTRLRCSAALGQ